MLIRMRKSLSRYWKVGLTVLFGLAVFLFWQYRYPFVLAYQEQLQLFLFDDDYFCERMSEPGGLARYIAEFMVQFYNLVTIGAAVIALLFVLVQRLMWRLMSSKTDGSYLLSFLPVVLLWYAMGDESVMLTYVIALIMALSVALAWSRWFADGVLWKKFIVALVIIPMLYWLIGPMVLLVALMMMPWLVSVSAVVYALGLMLLSAHFLPFPMMRVMLGISYYRIPVTLPYMLMVIPVVAAFITWSSRMDWLKWKYMGPLSAGVLVLGLLFVPRGYDARKYGLIEYDYLVRVGDWNAIIQKAERQMPDLPMSVSATNLALGMTNQLGDRAFDFYQRGTGGLLPRFERNFATAQLTGEIYFHLGLVNTAQRFAFEAMEAIPNYNKSARVVKRLAETNLINGQYEVARKYLQMLEKTVFYRLWAQRTMAMLGDEKAINGHPLYGMLRQYRLQDDFLFSERELDKICGQLFIHNQQNMMAAQYLLMMPLLDGDVARFMNYAQYVQGKIAYNPRHCQEAIAFAFFQQRQQPPQGLVNQLTLQQMNEFARVYGSDKNSPALAQFKNTVWYYLTAGK
ncbi:hypothetical protein SAMN04487850_2500 [Prevotella aff. ruminicola Tc2-24]|uniref:Transmembrane protein n=2 Tax=Prevotella aff. ruminicola Tc2-24 TaxID=81582 RepID=A0A1I0QK53_9BACT|nr:hypothetical protein SAMN04487850_2500 [Prevotella aff. ruminicola Tc2-24]